jgi:hypothetical protein
MQKTEQTHTLVFGLFNKEDASINQLEMPDPHGEGWIRRGSMIPIGFRRVQSIRTDGDGVEVSVETSTKGAGFLRITDAGGCAWMHDMGRKILPSSEKAAIVLSIVRWTRVVDVPQTKKCAVTKAVVSPSWPEGSHPRVVLYEGRNVR